MPKCPDCDYEGSVKGLGSHRKVHKGQKTPCLICGRRIKNMPTHMANEHPETLETSEELVFETAEHWEEFEAMKAQAARVPELEEAAARRLRNDRKLRKALRAAGVPLPKDLEKQ